MFFLKIPIETKEDGIKIAEDYFGSMCWRTMPDRSIEAYPYDNNPISIKNKVNQDKLKWEYDEEMNISSVVCQDVNFSIKEYHDNKYLKADLYVNDDFIWSFKKLSSAMQVVEFMVYE